MFGLPVTVQDGIREAWQFLLTKLPNLLTSCKKPHNSNFVAVNGLTLCLKFKEKKYD